MNAPAPVMIVATSSHHRRRCVPLTRIGCRESAHTTQHTPTVTTKMGSDSPVAARTPGWVIE
jgi:hypothetical protein